MRNATKKQIALVAKWCGDRSFEMQDRRWFATPRMRGSETLDDWQVVGIIASACRIKGLSLEIGVDPDGGWGGLLHAGYTARVNSFRPRMVCSWISQSPADAVIVAVADMLFYLNQIAKKK